MHEFLSRRWYAMGAEVTASLGQTGGVNSAPRARGHATSCEKTAQEGLTSRGKRRAPIGGRWRLRRSRGTTRSVDAPARLEGSAARRLHELANLVESAVVVAGELVERPDLRERLEAVLRDLNRALAKEGRLVCERCGRRSDGDEGLEGWGCGWRAIRVGDEVVVRCPGC
jgi:hypothetical protein